MLLPSSEGACGRGGAKIWVAAGEEDAMPRGSKASYTAKQKRKAEHIEQGYRERGVSRGEAERRAWATVNEQEGGGKRKGSGRRGSRR
jgi:hypothetical protein